VKNQGRIIRNQILPYTAGRLSCIANLIPPSSSEAYALDVGCSTGIMTNMVQGKGYTYVGLDISKDVLRSGNYFNDRKGNYLLQGNAFSLPFKRRFKLVVALEIIEHLQDPLNLVTGISNVLLDDGYAVVSTPNRASLEGFKGKIQEIVLKKRWNAWDTEHKHVFSSFEFLSLLNASFSVIRVCGYYFLPEIPFREELAKNWRLVDSLRFSRTCREPFNMLGFQTIALLKKVPVE
jgi:2-polyprenyl-3-methyl-5-hydroxy-6-metoxy-1,4-benzoquinol methylase